MFSTGTAAEIAARYDDTAVRNGCSNIFVYAAQAMAADFLRIGQSEKTTGVDLVGIDIISDNDNFSRKFCFHRCRSP